VNVASKELCEELYKVSGWTWEGSGPCYYSRDGSIIQDMPDTNNPPAYNLGYLLRKLPAEIKVNGISFMFMMSHYADWHVYYRDTSYKGIGVWRDKINKADTPEDAACLLAIQLFKEGILQPQKGGA